MMIDSSQNLAIVRPLFKYYQLKGDLMFRTVFNSRAVNAAMLLIASITAAMAADEEVSAFPYRPTVANPANLSAPGWLELELGAQRVKGGENKWRDSYPALAKLALTENWGVMLGGDLHVQKTDTSDAVFSGGGDMTYTIKHRIPTAVEGTAWGVEAGYKAPTASDTIGSGKSDYILNGIFSSVIAGNDLDLNLGATRVGSVAEGADANVYNWGASLSRSLNDQWGIFGELSGMVQSGMPAQSQAMAGLSYNLNKRVVLDAGATAGLTDATQNWSVFVGITSLIAKLW